MFMKFIIICRLCPNHNCSEYYKPHFLYSQVTKLDIVFSVLYSSCGWPSVPSKGFEKPLCCQMKICSGEGVAQNCNLICPHKLLLWGIVMQKELMCVVIKGLEFHMDHTHQIPVWNIF
jgi:hypothetical protein